MPYQPIDFHTLDIFQIYERVRGLPSQGFWTRGNARILRCPRGETGGHLDLHPSCKITPRTNIWYCYACGAGGDIVDMIVASGGEPNRTAAIRWLREQVQLPHIAIAGAQPAPKARHRIAKQQLRNEFVAAEYSYTDEAGAILYWIIRIEGTNDRNERDKRFEAFRPVAPKRFTLEWTLSRDTYHGLDGRPAFTVHVIGGQSGRTRGIRTEIEPHDRRTTLQPHVAHNVAGTRIVPYHLPNIVQAAERHRGIFLVEGEQDAQTLTDLGFAATSTPFGASFKPTPEWAAYFRGAAVVLILPDADPPGRRAAAHRARLLESPDYPTCVLDLFPDREDGYDVTNMARSLKKSGLTDADIRAAFELLFRNALAEREPS